jgi:hypothetical protein
VKKLDMNQPLLEGPPYNHSQNDGSIPPGKRSGGGLEKEEDQDFDGHKSGTPAMGKQPEGSLETGGVLFTDRGQLGGDDSRQHNRFFLEDIVRLL